MSRTKIGLVSFFKIFGKKIFFLLFTALLLFFGYNALAISRPYSAGEILDPDCSPGQTNCLVQVDPVLATGTVPFSDGAALTGDPTRLFWDAANHRLGVGTSTTSALLNLDAGTSTPSSAPLKFNPGSLLATPEAGAVEFNGDHLYLTASSTRYQLDQQDTSASSTIKYVSNTYSEVQALVSTGALVPRRMYLISDRHIILTAISKTQFATQGIYEYSAGKKAWGAVRTVGAGGSASAITVNGGDILGTTISYIANLDTASYHNRAKHDFTVDKSLDSTAAAIAAAINTHQDIYKAYAVNNWLFIEATATGVAANGFTISGTASGGLAVGSSTMQGGASDLATPKMFVCEYDFANDRLLSLYDPILKNLVSQTPAFQLANGNTILDFNWDDTRVYNNTFVDTIMSKNFMPSSSWSECTNTTINASSFNSVNGEYTFVGDVRSSVFSSLDVLFEGNDINFSGSPSFNGTSTSLMGSTNWMVQPFSGSVEVSTGLAGARTTLQPSSYIGAFYGDELGRDIFFVFDGDVTSSLSGKNTIFFDFGGTEQHSNIVSAEYDTDDFSGVTGVHIGAWTGTAVTVQSSGCITYDGTKTSTIHNNDFSNGVFGNNFIVQQSTISGNKVTYGEIYQNFFSAANITGNLLMGGNFNHLGFSNSKINHNKMGAGAGSNSEIIGNQLMGGSWIEYNSLANSIIDTVRLAGYGNVVGNNLSSTLFGDLIGGARTTFANSSFNTDGSDLGMRFYASTFQDDCFFNNNIVFNMFSADNTIYSWDISSSTFSHVLWEQNLASDLHFVNANLKGGTGPFGVFLGVRQSPHSAVEWSNIYYFNGGTGTGVQGSQIQLGQVSNLTSFDTVYMRPFNLVGAGASIKIGFTSDPAALLATTSIGSLTQKTQAVAIPQKRPLADPESIIMTVSGGSITSGSLQLIFKGANL